MATHHNFKIKNGLEVGGTLIVNSSGQLQAVTAAGNLSFGDGLAAHFGASNDLRLRHSTNSFIENFTNTLRIINYADDSDITIESDNGSGGVTPYITLDGSAVTTFFNKNTRHTDQIRAQFGNSSDLAIYHTGFDSYLDNATGHFVIRNQADNKDIVFQSDDGSGGLADYMRINGTNTNIAVSKTMVFADNSKASFGAAEDLRIKHDGSSSIIENITGHLDIKNDSNDADIRFFCDDGSNGLAEYMRQDGGIVKTVFSKNFVASDNVKGQFGSSADMSIFHDGTNSRIENSTGDLNITGSGDDMNLTAADDVNIFVQGGEIAAAFRGNGSVSLYDNNSEKLATTATGVNVTGNLAVSGDLTVSGSSTTLNTTTLDVEDKNITLNKGSGDTSSTADGAGITIQDAVSGSQDATLLWNSSGDHFAFSHRLFAPQFIVTDTNAVIFRNSNHLELKTFAGYNINLNASGKVGINTTSPAGDLHIKSSGDVGDALLIIEADADNNVETDNPRLELRQDGNLISGALYTEAGGGTTATGTLENGSPYC